MDSKRAIGVILVAVGIGVGAWLGSKGGDDTRQDISAPPASAIGQVSALEDAVSQGPAEKPKVRSEPVALQSETTAEESIRPPASPPTDIPRSFASPARFPLSDQGISAALAVTYPARAECYRAWAAYQPQIGDTLTMYITVGESDRGTGRVVQLELAETDNALLKGCLMSVFQDLPFETPGPTVKTFWYAMELDPYKSSGK